MINAEKLSLHAHLAAKRVTDAYADTDDHTRRAADHQAAALVPDLAEAVDELAAIITAVRRLHTIDEHGEWTCTDDDCDDCADQGHRGAICSFCTDYGSDDPDTGPIAIWPCQTVQLLEGLTAPDPSMPPPLHIEPWEPGKPWPSEAADLGTVVYGRALDVPSGIRFRSCVSRNRSWLRTESGAYRAWRHDTNYREVSDLWPQIDVDRFAPFVLWTDERGR